MTPYIYQTCIYQQLNSELLTIFCFWFFVIYFSNAFLAGCKVWNKLSFRSLQSVLTSSLLPTLQHLKFNNPKKRAGCSLLNYFSKILRKTLRTRARVTIHQAPTNVVSAKETTVAIPSAWAILEWVEGNPQTVHIDYFWWLQTPRTVTSSSSTSKSSIPRSFFIFSSGAVK